MKLCISMKHFIYSVLTIIKTKIAKRQSVNIVKREIMILNFLLSIYFFILIFKMINYYKYKIEFK